jgi:hypothetical protein
MQLSPTSVLDVGIGMGKWGLLTREYTDVWNRKFYEKDWTTLLIGLEIYKEYENPVWDLYDGIYIGDARTTIEKAFNLYGKFQLGIMIDVLEHFSKEDGIKVVETLLKGCDNLLLSYANCEQKDVCANKFEDHISKWSFSDFPPSAKRLLSGEGESWGLFLLRGT